MGETLARHLNCVVIDEKDKEAAVVRQCLLRAMISCQQQAPRWVFKDMDLGWLEEESDKSIESENSDESVPEQVQSKLSWAYIFTSLGSFVSGMLGFWWSTLTIGDSDSDNMSDIKEESIYSTAPLPIHHHFPTVLELLD